MKATLPGWLAIGLAGCATATSADYAADATGEERVAYRCEDGPATRMDVAFTEEAARVEIPLGETVTLARRPAGSGIAYQTANRSLLRRGDELTYTVDGDRIHCRAGLIPR